MASHEIISRDRVAVTTTKGRRIWRRREDGRWAWDNSSAYDVEGYAGHIGEVYVLDIETAEVVIERAESGKCWTDRLAAIWTVTAEQIRLATSQASAA